MSNTDDFYSRYYPFLDTPKSNPRAEGESWDGSDVTYAERDTPLVRAVRARMNLEIERQQQKDMANIPDQEPLPEMKKNLKDTFGLAKARTMAIPQVALFALGAAMQDGADKYGAFNFRGSEVRASIFHEAKQRHSSDWWERQDFAPDSLVHHLAHEMACCAILLDAIAKGNFIDDRPEIGYPDGISRLKNVWKKN